MLKPAGPQILVFAMADNTFSVNYMCQRLRCWWMNCWLTELANCLPKVYQQVNLINYNVPADSISWGSVEFFSFNMSHHCKSCGKIAASHSKYLWNYTRMFTFLTKHHRILFLYLLWIKPKMRFGQVWIILFLIGCAIHFMSDPLKGILAQKQMG